jgi:hypothetical protein
MNSRFEQKIKIQQNNAKINFIATKIQHIY